MSRQNEPNTDDAAKTPGADLKGADGESFPNPKIV